MATLPPIPAMPYDTVNAVLNAARVRLNDELKTLYPVGGAVLRNSHPFTQQAVNNAWRRAQEYLAERGYARLIDEVVVYGLPVVASADPASQTWLSWEGYFDGENLFPQPALPQGFSHPIKIWERWANQNASFGDPPMEKILDGLPSTVKTASIRFWEWRNDKIYMPGSQMVEDLRIRHVQFLPDFVDVGDQPWFNAPVPIVRASDGLSYLTCAELIGLRDANAAQIVTEKGEAALNRVFNLDVKADQRVNVRRRARSRNRGNYWY